MVEQKNRPSAITKALFKLVRLSAAQVGQQVGLSASNLFDAMAGRRGIPEANRGLLDNVLGLGNDLPIPDKIHYWSIGLDLSNLQTAVSYFFQSGATIAGLWRQGSSPIDLSRVFDKQQFAIYDDRTLVILMRTSIGMHAPFAKQIGPETIQGLSWKGGSVGTDTMVALPTEILQSLEQANFNDEQTLRVLLDCEPTVRWEDVTAYLKQRWHTPQTALDMLVKMTHEQQTKSEPMHADQRKHSPKM